MRSIAASWAVALALAMAGACSAPDTAPGTAPLECTCEPGERCLECYRHIGECCYEDPTIFGQVARLAENCEREGDCAACCNECVARSCDELRASDACPFQPPD